MINAGLTVSKSNGQSKSQSKGYTIAFNEVSALDTQNGRSYTNQQVTIASLNSKLDKKSFTPTNEFLSHYITTFNTIYEKQYKARQHGIPYGDYYYNMPEFIKFAFKMIRIHNFTITTALMNFIFRNECWTDFIDEMIDLSIKVDKKIPLIELINTYYQEERPARNKRVLNETLDKRDIKYFDTNDDMTIDYIFKYDFVDKMKSVTSQTKFVAKPKYVGYCIANNNKTMFDVLFGMGPVLSIQHLYLACLHVDIDVIKKLLDQKIKPDEQCIQNIFLSKDQSKAKQKIELLINYGYSVTKDDVLLAVKNGILLEDYCIAREYFSDEDFKKSLTDACNKSLAYAYEIKPNIDGLVENFRQKKSIGEIKDVIKKYGIDPNMDCLKEACKHGNNLSVIKFLMEKYDMKPDMECLINSAKIISNVQLRHVANACATQS